MKDKEMDILNLIKNRRTIRKYKDIPISKDIIEKIIEAGRWASSIHGFQPWRFVVITNHLLIKKISGILSKKSKVTCSGVDKVLSLTASTIANAPAIILIYNQNIFKDISYKFLKIKNTENSKIETISGVRIAEVSEIEAISGAIQNMILVAESLGIGSCWNTIPLFCEKEINELLGNNEQLIAVLTLGYPAEKGRRSPRKSIDKIVQYKY
jgi:nitroreductase